MSTQKGSRIAVVLALTGLLAGESLRDGRALAQEQTPASGAASPGRLAESRAGSAEVTPAPGPEVMRPTEYRVRATPAIERARALFWTRMLEEGGDLEIPPDKAKQLQELVARRLMEADRQYQQQLEPVSEHLVRYLFSREVLKQKLTADAAREIADRVRPLLPAIRDLLENLAQDTAGVLGPEQAADVDDYIQRLRSALEKSSSRMDRWAQGQFREGEEPFPELEQMIMKPESRPAEDAEESTSANREKREVRRSRRYASLTLQWITLYGVTDFLRVARTYFRFSPEQIARGDALLEAYRARLNAIMTAEWKERVQLNRFRYYMQRTLKSQPAAPYFHHLQIEYQAAINPVKQLGADFRAEVLALVTPEQRKAALGGVRQVAESHGLVIDPLDEMLLGLAATQPSPAEN